VRELIIASAGDAALTRALPGIPTNPTAEVFDSWRGTCDVSSLLPAPGVFPKRGQGRKAALMGLIRWAAGWMRTGP
jgi:hypothetical protein